jgi:hypothetical protein
VIKEPRWILLSLLSLGVVFFPSRAWAPPLCGRDRVEGEVLTLRVASVTIDGVATSVPPPPAMPFQLTSGCALQSLNGRMLDPDAADSYRATFWGLKTP